MYGHHHEMGPPGYNNDAQYPAVPPGAGVYGQRQTYDGYNSEPARQIARNSQSQPQQQYDPAFPLDSSVGPVPPPLYNHHQSSGHQMRAAHQLRPPAPGPMQAPASSYYGSTAGPVSHYPGMPPGRYSDEMFSGGVNTPRPMRFNPGDTATAMEMPMPYYGGRPADPRPQDSSANPPPSWDSYQADPYGRARQASVGEVAAARAQVPMVNPPPPPPLQRPAPVSGSEVDQFLAAYRKSTEQRYYGTEVSGNVGKVQDSRQYSQGPQEQNPAAETFSRPNRQPVTKTYEENPAFQRRRDLDDPMESGINPPPPESGGRSGDPDVSTFQRKVTHVEGEIGFAGTDLFFQMSKIKGNVRPQKGDSVVVKAERVHSMPFDWNALWVEVLSSQTEKSKSNKDDNDSFEQMPLMLPSTQQSKPLKSILKNKPAPPPPVISQQPSKSKIDYHHKKRTPSPDGARYEEKASRRSPSPPKKRKISPDRRSRSPDPYSRQPDARSRSPGRRSRSPGPRLRSPARRSRSPGSRSRSPAKRSRSPGRRSRSPPPRKRSHSPVIIRKLSPPPPPRGFSPAKSSDKSRDLSPVVRRIPPPPRENSPLSPIVVFRRRTPSPNAYFCISPTSGLRRKPPSPYLPKRTTTSPAPEVRKRASPGPEFRRRTSPGPELRNRTSPGPELRKRTSSPLLEMRRKSPSPIRRRRSSSSSSDSGRRKKSKSKKKSNRSRSGSPRGRSRRSPSPLRRKRSTSRSRNRSTSRSRRSRSGSRYRSLSPFRTRRARSRSASPDSVELLSSSKGRSKAPPSSLPKPVVKKKAQEVKIVRVPQKAPPPAVPKEKPRPMSVAFNWAKSAKEPPMLTGGLVKKAPAKKPRQQLPAFKVVETKKTDAEKLEEIKKKIQVEKLKLAGEKIQEEKKRLKAAVAAKVLEKKSGQDPPPVAPVAPSPSLMPNPAHTNNPNIYPNPHYSSNMMVQSYYPQPSYQGPYQNNYGPQVFPMYNEGHYPMGGPLMSPMMSGPIFQRPQLMPPVQPRPEIPPSRLFRSTMDSIRGIRTTMKSVNSSSKADTSCPPVAYAKVSTPQPQVSAKVPPSKGTSKIPEKVPAAPQKPSSSSCSEKLKPPGEDDDDVTVISIKTSEKLVQLENVPVVASKPEVEVIQLEPSANVKKEPEPDEIDDDFDIMEPSMAFELGCHPDKTSKARNWMICVRCAQRGHLISMCDKLRIPRALPFEISQAREMLVESKREHLEEVAKLKGNDKVQESQKKTDATKLSESSIIDDNNTKSSQVSKSADGGKRSEVGGEKKQNTPAVVPKPPAKVLSSKLTKSTREKFEQEMMMTAKEGPPSARRPIRLRNSSAGEGRRDDFVVESRGPPPVPIKPVFRISRRRSVSPSSRTTDDIQDPMKAVAVKQLELEELSLRDMEIGKKMQILRMQKDKMKFSSWSGEDDMRREYERPDPFCYICFKRGHKAKKCNAPCPSWIRLRVRVREGMLVERAPGQMEPFCLACGKCGHFTRTCYQRQPYEVYSDDD